MKYIKTHEHIKDGPKIGDYVVCNEDIEIISDATKYLTNFTSTNIGKIVLEKHTDDRGRIYDYSVEYYNIPIKLSTYFKDNCRPMYRKEIIAYSKYKEELYPFLTAKKYNL